MFSINEKNICISLDPRTYLIDDSNLDNIYDKADDLLLLLDDVINNNVKVLYNSYLESYDIDCINLFDYDEKDPIIVSLTILFEEHNEIIQKINTYSDTEEDIDCLKLYNEQTQKLLCSSWEEQYIKYDNTIVLSDIENEISFEDRSYYFTKSLDIMIIKIEALKECRKDNVQDLLYIYQWFFDRVFKNNIVYASYIISNINSFSIDFNNAIISLFRSIYYPEFLIKKGIITDNKFVIECHPDKYNEVSINKHHKIRPYRTHVVNSLNTRRGGIDRFYYLKKETKVAIVGISNSHKFHTNISPKLESYINDNLI